MVCCLRYRGKQRHSKNAYPPDYEVSLLRLIEKVTNGTVIEISLTGVFYILLFGVDLTRLGTAILIKPGIISGGSVTHECPTSRSIGYFLEPIIMLAPFSKKLLALTLRGITTDDKDLSVRPLQTSRWIRLLILLKVDLIRTVTLPHLEPFGISDGLELKVSDPFSHRHNAHPCPKIKKRGSPPLGGGEVLFLCPIVKQVKTLNFVEPGKIKRIRGIAYAVIILT